MSPVPSTPGPPRGTVEVASPELFRHLVESVSDYAIFSLDPEGRVMSWNQGAQRLKGYAASEVLGRHFSMFYPPEEVAAGKPTLELEIATRDGRVEDEGWRVRKDGSRFWANVTLSLLHDSNGRLLGFSKVTRDLTERLQAEQQARRLAAEEAARAEATRRNEELALLNEQLRVALANAETARVEAERAAAAEAEAHRELDQFAYIASHDLKAPLRGIANLAQWLQDDLGDRLGPESARHMELLQGRVRRMEALIDGILAYSRAGRQLSTVETVATGELIRDVIGLLAPDKRVRIHVADRMPIVEAERVPLQQVFMNLIGNAIKYTTAARDDAAIRVEWRDAGEAIEFAVADNGPGIAPEYHDRIWGIFQTLAARDKVEGTGIGLAVVRKLVERRGGRAWVDSAPSAGATFRFTWPKTGRPGTQA